MLAACCLALIVFELPGYVSALDVPPYRGYVNDYAAMLSPGQALKLERALQSFDLTDSTQVAISPDKQDITVTINITEGQPYTVTSVKLEGDYLGKEEDFKTLVKIKPGEAYRAEAVTETRIARVFIERCIDDLIAGRLDPVTAAMVKYWTSDKQGEVIDSCLQLFGGYGYMAEYPISHMWTDARVQRIYGGTNEIMKLLIARSL